MTIKIEQALKDSLKWFHAPGALKYALIIWATNLAIIIVSLLLFFLFLEFVFQGFFECIFSYNCGTVRENISFYLGSPEFPQSLFLIMVLFIFLLVFFDAIVSLILLALVELFALRFFGFKPVVFNKTKIFRYLLLRIALLLSAYFWSFDKRLRVLQFICFVFLVLIGFSAITAIMSFPALYQNTQITDAIEDAAYNNTSQTNKFIENINFPLTGFVSLAGFQQTSPSFFPRIAHLLTLFLFAFLILIPYGIIVLYNLYRLFVAPVIFLNNDISVMSSLKESWDLMKGNVFMAFVSVFAVFFVLGLIASAGEIILGEIFSFALMPTPVSSLGAGNIVTLTLLSIGIPLLISLILMPLYFFAPSFLLVSIYSMVLKKTDLKKE